MQLNIDDQKQFYYRFQIPKKNRISIEKINFDLEKNLDEKKYYLSNIKINSMNDDLNSSKINLFDDHEINNIQTLTKLINDYLEAIN